MGIDILKAATAMASRNVTLQRERNQIFRDQAAPCTFHTHNVFLPAPAPSFMVWLLPSRPATHISIPRSQEALACTIAHVRNWPAWGGIHDSILGTPSIQNLGALFYIPGPQLTVNVMLECFVASLSCPNVFHKVAHRPHASRLTMAKPSLNRKAFPSRLYRGCSTKFAGWL